jgi:hypothetical protein
MSSIYGAVGWLAHLIHQIFIGFLSFGSVAVLLASIIGVAMWLLRELGR